MARLLCTTCTPTGRLPAELAGGVIRIGPAAFDDPLAGACPEPRFAIGRSETMAAFLGRPAGVKAQLRRLAPPEAVVVPVAVTCKPPPHARQPVGAVVSLTFVARDMLLRCWEDGSIIVLRRLAPAPSDRAPIPND